jgi:hypothetical protein
VARNVSLNILRKVRRLLEGDEHFTSLAEQARFENFQQARVQQCPLAGWTA